MRRTSFISRFTLQDRITSTIRPVEWLSSASHLQVEVNVREEELYERVYTVVRLIPPGRVATYGQVAAVVGPPCDAREVGGAMAALRYQRVDPPVPWQRVINTQGNGVGEAEVRLFSTAAQRMLTVAGEVIGVACHSNGHVKASCSDP